MWGPDALRRCSLLAAALVCAAVCGCGDEDAARPFPRKAIKVVVPFRPGGETDTFARIIEKAIEDEGLLPVPIVIINRDGAGATVGSRSVKNARPDGYTVLLLHNALMTAKYAGTVSYGPEAFEPVAGTGEFGMVIAVSKSSRFATLRQLLEEAARRPRSVTFAVNRGTPSHFAALMLEHAYEGSSRALFRFTQSGSGVQRYEDVRSGHIDVSVFSVGEYVRFPDLRALAYFGETRDPGLPDVPTAREQGIDVVSTNMQFWWYPKGTPKDRVDYLAAVLEKAMRTTFVRERLKKLLCRPVFLKGEALRQRIAAETQRLESVSLRPTIPLPPVEWILLGSTLFLLGLVVAQRWHSNRSKEGSSRKFDFGFFWQPMPLLLLVVLYVASLGFELDFRAATAIFVVACGALLAKGINRSLLVFAILGIGLALILGYVFTQWLVIDLP